MKMPTNATVDEALARAEVRRGNKWMYALSHGLLFWGVPCWLLVTIIRFNSHEDDWLSYAVITLPVWCIGGFLFGLWRWRFGLWPVRLTASIYKRLHSETKPH